MSNCVHVTGGFSGSNGTTALLTYDLGSVLNQVYVKMQIYLPAASFAMWFAGAPFQPYLLAQSPDTNPADWDQVIGPNSDGSLYDNWGNWMGGTPLTTGAWHVLELWLNSAELGDPSWYKLDGLAGGFGSGAGPPATMGEFATRLLVIGLDGGYGYHATAPTDLWVGKVQVGTAPLTSDVLDYDPATSSYTPTFGTVLGAGSAVAMAAPPSPNPASMNVTPQPAGSIHLVYSGADSTGMSGIGIAQEFGAKTSLYGRFELLVTAANAAALNACCGGARLLGYRDFPSFSGGFPNDFGEMAGVEEDVGPGLDAFWIAGDGFADDDVFTPDVWHVVEVFWQKGGASYMKIDGGAPLSYTGSAGGVFWDAMFFASVGAQNVSTTAFDVWLNRVKIGTSNGGGDVVDYDPGLRGDLYDAFLVCKSSASDSVVQATPPVAPPGTVSPNLAGFGGTVPVPVSASIDGGLLVVTFDNPLDPAHVPNPAQFDVNYDGSPATVLSAAVPGGPDCEVSTAPDAAFGQTVTVQYARI